MTTILERLLNPIIERRLDHALNAIRVTDDNRWWSPMTNDSQLNTIDLVWAERREMLEDTLHEWRTNPYAYRITAQSSAFVIGDGISATSNLPDVQRFITQFWNHPQNRIDLRLFDWSDELVRAGELFLVLSRNAADGMSYVREVPALFIDDIETEPGDREAEKRYHQLTNDVEGIWWTHPRAADPSEPQIMLHYATNKPTGAIRGTPDLAPILRWLRRYSEWLEDRARLNKYRAAFLWHAQITNPSPGEIERKRSQYAKTPTPGSILITDDKETWTAINPQLASDDASKDGHAMRLAIAAGGGVPLHFLSEGESATRATAREMNKATLRAFKERQTLFAFILRDLLLTAYQRATNIAAPTESITIKIDPITFEEEAENDPHD